PVARRSPGHATTSEGIMFELVSTDDPQGFLDRDHLLQSNADEAELAYARARDAGMADPVVFVLDLNDPFARHMAAGLPGRRGGAGVEGYARWLGASQPPRPPTPPAPAAAVKQVDRFAAPRRISIPPGHFLIIAVAAGGNLYRFRPVPPGNVN